MNIKRSVLARKYAEAFLNTYPEAVSRALYETLHDVVDYCGKQKVFFLILSVPTLTFAQRMDALQKQLESFNLPSEFDRLIHLLLTQHRIMLLPDIFQQIITVYEHRNNIMEFSLKCSSPLTDKQKRSLNNFISKKTGYQINSKTIVDSTLIAGLRLQSNTLLWEHSIAKQLRTIKESLGQ